ncbi:hypothetical protein THAOC_17865, partial [Thalassiosira oceanica]
SSRRTRQSWSRQAETNALRRETKALRDDIEALRSDKKALEWSLERLTSKVQEGWEYAVTIQPDEYWQSKGYDDEDIGNLRDAFLGELKGSVSSLEHGVCDSISVGLLGYVFHDEDLMPHWNALFRSFDYINPYDEGVRLRLHSIELNEEIMRQVCNYVRHKNIGRVSFEYNQFTNMRGAIIELGEALRSPKLKSFTWCENPIESIEDMNLFTRVLSQSSALDELKFTENGNENAHALLSGVDFSTYKVLNFSDNSLRMNGRTDIPDLIAANAPLEELDLSHNRLNDDDAVLIAQSLGGNTNLKQINVRRNNIQERGMRALYEAVHDTSTLNALSDSNHSCHLVGLSEDFNIYPINEDRDYAISDDRDLNGLYTKGYTNRMLKLGLGLVFGSCTNRMLKIHRLMVERYRRGGGIVPHLNTEMGGGDSILLLPFLMESVVRRHDAFRMRYDESSACSLGLLYELVKDWKMAELFSFR